MNAPRPDYFTPAEHYQEAQRLLWVIDGELQSDAPRTTGELAVIALAHAVTALAADVFDEDRQPDCADAEEPEDNDSRRLGGDEAHAAEDAAMDQIFGTGSDTRRLGEIRAVLARFDWEHDDRQLALEAIERIADGGQA